MYLGALGLNTLTSKNARWYLHQTPLALISSRASLDLFALLPLVSVSPVNSYNRGSMATSEHTTSNKLAVRSLTSLWRCITKPPFLQESACSMVKMDPQAHLEGNRVNGHPYLTLIASQNSLLHRWKPFSSIGSAVSQFDNLFLGWSHWLAFLQLSFGVWCSPAYTFVSLCKPYV